VSALHVYTLACDTLSCTARFQSNHDTVWKARIAARKRGWAHLRRRRPKGGPAESIDYCPAHAQGLP
jgi:hypothetical protein